ncbi:DEAD-box type RNA helicase, partial [Gonapodya sp. JEL0774]
ALGLVLKNCTIINDFIDVVFSASADEPSKRPSENDLMSVTSDSWKGGQESQSSKRPPSFLMKVTSVEQIFAGGSKEWRLVARLYQAGNSLFFQQLTPGSRWRGVRQLSLTTLHREYQGLQALEHAELSNEIVTGVIAPSSVKNVDVSDIAKQCNLNEPQARAVATAVNLSRGFTLIQGPPGTGKTRTIVEIVRMLYNSWSSKNSTTSGGSTTLSSSARLKGLHLLISTPSNAGCDEIARRLMKGVADSVASDVKDILLDQLVERKVNTMNTNQNPVQSDSDVRKELQDVIKERTSVEKELNSAELDIAKRDSLEKRRQKLNDRRRQLSTKLDDIKRLKQQRAAAVASQRTGARITALNEADVVLSTLSGTGHEILTQLSHGFETLILDEAGQ